MSEENVEIVRRIFDAAARRDSASILALYDPEVEWDNSRSGGEGLMAPGIYRGHDGLRQWFREWSGPWANLDYRIGEVIDGGERVIAAATMSGLGQASGVEVEWTQYAVWTIRNGKGRPRCLVPRPRRGPRSRRARGVTRLSPSLRPSRSEVRDLGEQVIAIGHLRGRGRESGARTETAIVWLVEFKDAGPLARSPSDPRSD